MGKEFLAFEDWKHLLPKLKFDPELKKLSAAERLASVRPKELTAETPKEKQNAPVD